MKLAPIVRIVTVSKCKRVMMESYIRASSRTSVNILIAFMKALDPVST